MSGALRLLVVTGSRADFGLWLPILAEARRREARVAARLLVAAMHLDPRFGGTVDEVRRSGGRQPGGDGVRHRHGDRGHGPGDRR
jgi:hypothetical protein